MNIEKIKQDLKSILLKKENLIQDQNINNINIINEKNIIININLNNPTLHFKKKIEKFIITALKKKYKNIFFDINFINKKNNIIPSNINKNRSINNIKNIIGIASGKGGVGKSTLTTNIAISLTKMNLKIGIIDADIYGPSIPILFNIKNININYTIINGIKKIEPILKYNIKILSMGFFIAKNQAIVWRGPMATKALRQLIHDTNWGDLDILIIDLPPGTGDIHLSMVQELSINGMIIISTPQKLALSDVEKAISMFKMDNINVPILGLVENMSFFTIKELPNNKYYIFGKDGVKKLSQKLNIPFLGEIPIQIDISQSSDIGIPIALNNDTNIYNKITLKLIKQLKIRNKNLPATNIVNIHHRNGCK